MVHPRGHVLSYNGEIYGFAELRRTLEREGVVFRSTSDTEVVLEAYARWGEGMLERLRGMFAIALWDAERRQLLLARDRLGIKPLYHSTLERPGGTTLVFASEVRALLAGGLVERRICPVGLQTFLWNGAVQGPRTIVRGVRLLAEGTRVWIDRDGTTHGERRYWTLPGARPVRAGRASQAPGEAVATDDPEGVREAGRVLAESVAQHVVSDVPLGVFLSGGIDSSAIAALASRACTTPLRTFSVGFDEAPFDESPHARAVARALGTDHTDVRLTPTGFRDGLDDALDALDQPTFDGINTWFVSRAVRREGITVALAGTGGDELFGGYRSFVDIVRARRALEVAGKAPKAARDLLASAIGQVQAGAGGELRPQARWGKLDDLLASGGGLLEVYQTHYALFTRAFLSELSRVVPEEGTDWGLPSERAASLRHLVAEEPELHGVSMLELGGFLGNRLLRDTDVASMAVSLEVRVPLLDHVFVESLAKVPIERRFLPVQRKQLLRDLALDGLPRTLFDRPKRGFELPLARWIRDGLQPRLERTLTNVVLAHRIGLDGEAVTRVWRAHRDGAPGIPWTRVWALFVLMHWSETHGLTL